MLMFLAFSLRVAAQTSDGPAAGTPLFSSHDVLEVRIEAPLRTLIRDRPEEEYLDGFFTYLSADGSEQKLDLKVRSRGKYRRQKKTCTLPPIRLNFSKDQVKGTEFAGQDKLKLVTHCKSTSDRYEQMVLREYLAYRILQTLTDNSFGARLLHITYVDSEGKEETVVRYGFVIEDDDDIATRIGLDKLKMPSTNYDALNPRQTNLVAVFEYMIGNTDFSMIAGPANSDCCHNIVLYGEEGSPITPIPYDFDFAGLVNAPYAEPNPQFKLRNVRIRLYRGRCSNNQYLEDTFALFREKEAEIRAHISGMPGLTDGYAEEVTKYLDAFYETIGDESSVAKSIIRECS
jgi:hypothetical protein